MVARRVTWLVTSGLACSASAQVNTFYITVSNVITHAQPSASIELWAAFDPTVYAFSRTKFDFLAEADPGGFSDPIVILPSVGDVPGEVSPDGDRVFGAMVWNFCYPPIGYWPDESNPILLWGVTWSTDDFTARTVDLSTATARYDLYPLANCVPESYLDNDFAEGFAQITVVPAPGGTVAVGACIAVAGRRRRSLAGNAGRRQ